MRQVFLCSGITQGITNGIVPDLSFFHFKRDLTPALYQGTDYFCLHNALKMDPGESYYLNSMVSEQLFERSCLWPKTSCRELSPALCPPRVAAWLP